jgi:hypothetical protein
MIGPACRNLFAGAAVLFGIKNCNLLTTGRNSYFILEPGFQLVLEGGGTRLEVLVLDETKVVDDVTTRVVEEREWKDGKLYEVSRNYFAMCRETKDVFYFGEDVDYYENGKVVKHGRAKSGNEVLSGDRSWLGNGSCGDRQPHRNVQDPCRHLRRLPQGQGKHGARS